MRWRGTRSTFLETLREKPFLSSAAKKVGVARATIYRWIKDDPAFAAEVAKGLELGRDHLNDFAETKLVTLINRESLGAIKFWLQNNHKRYTPERKQERPAAKGRPLTLHDAKSYRDQLLRVFRNMREDGFPQGSNGIPMASNEVIDFTIKSLEALTDEELIGPKGDELRKIIHQTNVL